MNKTMRYVLGSALICMSISSMAEGVQQKPSASTPPPPVINCSAAQTGDSPPMPNKIDSTCASMPKDILGSGDTQSDADQYSWLTFIAANWPVDPKTCSADTAASILTSAQNPTWLSFLTDDDVFVASGKPAGWCAQPTSSKSKEVAAALSAQQQSRIAQLPPVVRTLAQAHPEVRLYLHYSGKSQALVSAASAADRPISKQLQQILDATAQPVTDQNGRFVRYAVYMNADEYGYIKSKNLWNKAGQKAAGNLTFPSSNASTIGAMEFKSAWKVLGKNDDPSRFFTQMAIVYNDENGSPSPGPNPVTVGLVGLHITHKTQRQPHWLWSTFEQVDNDTRSFYNPDCLAKVCPPNMETARKPYKELNSDGSPHNKPVQVVPFNKAPTNPAMNAVFQDLLKGTPWTYYKLVGTQWEGGFGAQPKPAKLGNSVLETFVSDTKPYSCIGCHKMANDIPANFTSDFSFIINAKQ
ncbi:MAG: hypothetical protein IH605_06560 [Burkholderiales bacterium]|nr:hypothetical protein [Burkholderiales bacterium]